jgi:FAD/FMN-containing dehydrogenase
VEIPLGRTAEFVRWFLREVPINPVWLCPLRLRETGPVTVPAAMSGMTGLSAAGESPDRIPGEEQGPWPLYPLHRDQTYVNVGFWSTVPILPESRDGDANRRIEGAVAEHEGHKSLYSDSYYPPEEFWTLYGGTTYARVKARYDPESRLLDLYAKAVGRR